MPLHQIPLCGFNYVGDILSSATFKYDTSVSIVNNLKTNLYYKRNTIEIDKSTNNKNFYSSTLEINKPTSKSIFKEVNSTVNKNIEMGLNKSKGLIDKCISKDLILIYKSISKENLLALNGTDIDISMIKDKNLLDTKYIELSKDISQKQFVKDLKLGLSNSNYIIDMEKCNKTKDINVKFSAGLDRDFLKGMGIKSSVNLNVIREQELGKARVTYLGRNKEKDLGVAKNNKYLDKDAIRPIDIKNNIVSIIKATQKKAAILKEIYLNREINRIINKDNSSKLAYKTNDFNLDKYSYINVEKDIIKNIIKPINSKMLYINTLKRILEINNALGLNKNNINRISKHNAVALSREFIKDIIKDYNISAENISCRNIYKYDLLGLNKSDTEVFTRIHRELIEKSGIDITKNIYKSIGLEVIKRWWILRATEPADQKILPWDYSYLNNPLAINRRDREYGNLIDMDKHSISFMPYLEGNVGIDLNYGLEEMALSIEIMLDMVNIVGMIVQHGASQFANVSGQESIEFIMELLLDWLNLDSTVQEMNNKCSREHYLRSYRWIRWEAEKVWFMADKDHTQDGMRGIKYAGILFTNLLDYMKYHHFNIVPLWRNLKYMDIERQFNRIATNGDIIQGLDKLKCKRHYFIETQKNILGGK